MRRLSAVIAVALAGLLVYVAAFVAVLVVRGRVRRAVRVADAPLETDARLPTGGELARRLLDAQGLGPVTVVAADVDAYRALSRELQLAEGRDERASVAAWAIAAHEVGHATQHKASDPTWSRWWVLSGHGVWIGVALPALLVAQLVIPSPLPVLLALVCASVLIATTLLSRSVERDATATAHELLAGAGLPADELAWAQRLLRDTAAGYVAESLLDTGFIDRAAEPWRGEAVGGDSAPW
jgi:uncharacterized protein